VPRIGLVQLNGATGIHLSPTGALDKSYIPSLYFCHPVEHVRSRLPAMLVMATALFRLGVLQAPGAGPASKAIPLLWFKLMFAEDDVGLDDHKSHLLQKCNDDSFGCCLEHMGRCRFGDDDILTLGTCSVWHPGFYGEGEWGTSAGPMC
jgi:hypothetical protein